MIRHAILVALIALTVPVWAQVKLNKNSLAPFSLQRTTLSLTEVMMHDVASPPVAARFYAYCLMSGYMTAYSLDSSLIDLRNAIANHNFKKQTAIKNADLQISSLYSILETGKKIMPSGYLLQTQQDDLIKEALKRKTKKQIESSIQLAQLVSDDVIAVARQDGYFQLSTLQRYKPIEGGQYWQPTPPAYISAIEPNWRNIQTFLLDSIGQIECSEPIAFDTLSSSPFYQLSREVYSVSLALSNEQKLIANYWDCNPFAVQRFGHLNVGLKKMSPGAHWLNISGILCEQKKLSFSQSLLIQTVLTLGMHDCFVTCWNEKFKTNRLRPETAIRLLIDSHWTPLLQTPPFPEYTSGHSIVSTYAGKILTYFFGPTSSFTDNTETNFGMPTRSFKNIETAAQEACISRLYGGIHFRDAIENGQIQGAMISSIIIRKLSSLPSQQLKAIQVHR